MQMTLDQALSADPGGRKERDGGGQVSGRANRYGGGAATQIHAEDGTTRWCRRVCCDDGPAGGADAVCAAARLATGLAWLFVGPNLIVFGLFTFLPILLDIWYAFTGGTDLLPAQRPWVGRDNLQALLSCQNHFDPYELHSATCSGTACGTH